MIVIGEKVCWVHVRKTGGEWTRRALASACREPLRVPGDRNPIAPAPHLRHVPAKKCRRLTGLPTIACVRDVASWWESIWLFKVRRGWRSREAHMAGCTFEQFVHWQATGQQDWYGEMVEAYADGADLLYPFSGNLADGLGVMLSAFEVDVDWERLRAQPRHNVAPSALRKQIAWTPAMRAIADARRAAVPAAIARALR